LMKRYEVFKMNMKKIIEVIKKHQRFLITTHMNPDPDALSSELAVALYLRSLKKKVFIVNNEAVPNRYRFFPGSNQIKKYRDQLAVDYDVAVVLDCGDLDRVGRVKHLIAKKNTILNIDHHITNDGFGRWNLVEAEASSVAEILYDLFKAARYRLNDRLACFLYAGMMTDTGCFRYENTTARTHLIVGELMRYKFSAYDLYRKLYETIT